MEKNNNSLRDRSNNTNNNNITISSNTTPSSSSSDFLLQWGNRKRLRCMKQQVKEAKDKVLPRSITARADRRSPNHQNKQTLNGNGNGNGQAYINLRQRSSSPAAHRVLRNSENSTSMKGGQSNGGGGRGVCSPERGGGGAHDKRTSAHHNHNGKNNNNGGGSGSSETAHDSKKGTDNETAPIVWPPKFTIGLTNKEKEEDFLAIKGSKLPQRPKKRAKFIQRTINLVTPGGWLCDLTLERYEVREKKITKKRPRGLKAMGSMESESE